MHKPELGGGERLDALLEVEEVPAETVQTPDHKRVPRPGEVEGLRQARLRQDRAADTLVAKDALTLRRGQGVELKAQVLIFRRNAGVADQHVRNLAR